MGQATEWDEKVHGCQIYFGSALFILNGEWDQGRGEWG